MEFGKTLILYATGIFYWTLVLVCGIWQLFECLVYVLWVLYRAASEPENAPRFLVL